MAARKRTNTANKNGSKWIRVERRLAIYLRDGFTCCYCGKDLRQEPPAAVTLDHLRPRSAGGTNESTNIITACHSCNSTRQDKPWVDFAPGGARDRIEQLRHSPLNLPLAKAILSGEVGDPRVEGER